MLSEIVSTSCTVLACEPSFPSALTKSGLAVGYCRGVIHHALSSTLVGALNRLFRNLTTIGKIAKMYILAKIYRLTILAMKIITATELKNKTAEAIELARSEPVSVEKNGRPSVVIISQADYDRMVKLENEYWLSRALQAEKSGFIGAKATSSFIQSELRRHAKTRHNE
jgi:prevent-host-death family protein